MHMNNRSLLTQKEFCIRLVSDDEVSLEKEKNRNEENNIYKFVDHHELISNHFKKIMPNGQVIDFDFPSFDGQFLYDALVKNADDELYFVRHIHKVNIEVLNQIAKQLEWCSVNKSLVAHMYASHGFNQDEGIDFRFVVLAENIEQEIWVLLKHMGDFPVVVYFRKKIDDGNVHHYLFEQVFPKTEEQKTIIINNQHVDVESLQEDCSISSAKIEDAKLSDDEIDDFFSDESDNFEDEITEEFRYDNAIKENILQKIKKCFSRIKYKNKLLVLIALSIALMSFLVSAVSVGVYRRHNNSNKSNISRYSPNIKINLDKKNSRKDFWDECWKQFFC